MVIIHLAIVAFRSADKNGGAPLICKLLSNRRYLEKFEEEKTIYISGGKN
jgi:hypothetical protein